MQVEEIPDYGDDQLTVYSKTTFATIPLVLEVYLVIALIKHPASGKSASKKKPRRSSPQKAALAFLTINPAIPSGSLW